MLNEETFIDFTCPHCGEAVSFPQAEAGCLRECPNCMDSLLVAKGRNAAGGKVPLPVTTPRLTLRRFQPEDWKALMELMPDVGEDYVLNWMEQERQVRLTTPEHTFHLGIALKDNGELIGYLTLRFTDAERLQGLMDIRLAEKHPGQDFGPEAVDALLGFCFEGIHLHRVQATCASHDAARCQLFEEVGLRREGEFVKDTRLPDGTWGNSIWFAALSEEYESEKRAGP